MPRSLQQLDSLRGALAAAAGFDGAACFIVGNRCGHVLNEPRDYLPPPGHDPRPEVIREFNQAFRGFAYNADILPNLARAPRREKRRWFERIRSMRSEAREGCVLMMEAIMHYYDLVTARSLKPLDNLHKTLRGVSMEELCAMAGLSLPRGNRAMENLKLIGVKVHPIAEEEDDGELRGRAAIRTVPDLLFNFFGLGFKLKRAAKHASKKLKEKRAQPPTPEEALVARGQAQLERLSQARDAALGISAEPEPPHSPQSRGPPA